MSFIPLSIAARCGRFFPARLNTAERQCFLMRACATWAIACLLLWPAHAPAADFSDPPSELATVLARNGKRAEKAGDLAQAYVYYSQASALQPKNRGYRKHAAALRLAGAKQIQEASGGESPTLPGADKAHDGEVHHAFLPKDLLFDSVTARQISLERHLSSPPALAATAGKFDFDLNDTPRNLYEKVASRYGLQVVFDSDFSAVSSQPIRFRITDVDYRAAFDALQVSTDTFIVPIGTHAIMVARDTVQKRNDLEQYVVLTLNVPQVITSQELTEIVQVVRQTTNVEKIGWDTNTDQLVVRDRVSRAALAQALIGELFGYHPEVMIELELLQVTNSDILNYGFSVTNTFQLIPLGHIANNLISIPNGVTNLLTFGGGKTLVGIAAAQVQAMFNEGISNSRSLYTARLRAGSGTAGVFHVGQKYPMITSGFVNGSTGTNGGTTPSFIAPPAITFEDLGLEMKVTPTVHGSNDVSLGIEASYEALTGQSADGIPILQNSQVTTDVRVRNGEWSIIGGLISDSKSKAKGGFLGLANIPFLGQLFSHTFDDTESTSFLIGVRPYILSLGPSETKVTMPLRAGTDQRPFTPF
jgi:type II secretory pathway component GspD/PulD (secretin)